MVATKFRGWIDMSAKERVEQELVELETKIESLAHFIAMPAFDQLSMIQRELLEVQWSIMLSYKKVLQRRLYHWEEWTNERTQNCS
jgi:hypothetical protein